MVDSYDLHRVEWCVCAFPTTFVGLAPTGVDGTQAWVHDSCGKPTFEYWQAHEKYCDECGRSFSSPYSDVCRPCSPLDQLVTWLEGLQRTAEMRPWAGHQKTLEMCR